MCRQPNLQTINFQFYEIQNVQRGLSITAGGGGGGGGYLPHPPHNHKFIISTKV